MCETTTIHSVPDEPIVTKRSSSCEWSGSRKVLESESANTLLAWSNEIPCFLRFASFFSASHSNSTRANYPTDPSKLTPSSFCASTANSIGSSRMKLAPPRTLSSLAIIFADLFEREICAHSRRAASSASPIHAVYSPARWRAVVCDLVDVLIQRPA